MKYLILLFFCMNLISCEEKVIYKERESKKTNQDGFEVTNRGSEAHGGDIPILRESQELNKKVQTIQFMTKVIEEGELKEKLISVIENLVQREKTHSEEEKAFLDYVKELHSQGLIDDIQNSPYRLAQADEYCHDVDGIHKFATARNNERNGEICFDLKKAHKFGHLMTMEDLLGFAFHEHIHHFGERDRDHQLAKNFIDYGEKSWTEVDGKCFPNLLGSITIPQTTVKTHYLPVEVVPFSQRNDLGEYTVLYQFTPDEMLDYVRVLMEKNSCSEFVNVDMENLKCLNELDTTGQMKNSSICHYYLNFGYLILEKNMELGTHYRIQFSRL